MVTIFQRLLQAVVMLGFVAWGTAQAAPTGFGKPLSFEGYVAASDAELDSMRGGFEISAYGMQFLLAFSIDGYSFINGELVASYHFNVMELLSSGTLASAFTRTTYPPPASITVSPANPTIANTSTQTAIPLDAHTIAPTITPIVSASASPQSERLSMLTQDPILTANHAQTETVAADPDTNFASVIESVTTLAETGESPTIIAPEVTVAPTGTTPPPLETVAPTVTPEVTVAPTETAPPLIETMAPTVTPGTVLSLNMPTLIQNGAGNSFDGQTFNSFLTTVIQNTVDNQIIQNFTVLNATLATSMLAAAAELNAALQGIAGSVR